MRSLFKILVVLSVLSISCKNNRVDVDKNKESQIEKVTDRVIDTEAVAIKDSIKNIDTQPVIKANPFIRIEDSTLSVIGIVQSSGIRSFDKIDIEADYQIVSLNKAFFLLSTLDLKDYWGKCVKVKGRLLNGWDITMTDYNYNTFGRIPLELEVVNEISCDSCSWIPYPKREIKSYTYKDEIKGYLFRGKRPAPDIGWDYRIKLDSSIPHPEDPEKFESRLKSLIIHPNINLDYLNKIIKDSLHIKATGLIAGGYAESIVFKTDSIIIVR